MYSENVRHPLRVPGGVAVLRLEGEDQGLDRLLLAGLQLEVARERRPRDQDRHDEQRHDRSTKLQIHPTETKPKQGKRKCTNLESGDLPQHLEIRLIATESHRDA